MVVMEQPNRLSENPRFELQKIKTETVVVELSELGLIQATGEDTLSFLQGQLSCDVRKIQPEQAQYGCYCSPKGRILANFLAWSDDRGQDVFLQIPRSILESIRKRLSLFVLRAKVKLLDPGAESIRLGIAGEQARKLLSEVLPTLTLPELPLGVAHGPGITIVSLAPNRFELIATPEQGAHLKTMLTQQATLVSFMSWQWLDIQAGLPTILAETQEQFVPQMVNMDLIGGVSFQKGCYPGQEIVARTQYLGKLKRRMALVRIETAETAVAAGDALYSESLGDQTCGMIVNAVPIAEGVFEALAVIPIEVWNSTIQWKSLQGPTVTLLSLPYALPEVTAK